MKNIKSLLLNKEYITLFLIILGAFILRIYIATFFYAQSSDEFFNVFLVRRTFESGFTRYGGHFMYLYYFISALLLFFVNNAFVATRIVSIIFSTFSILVLYFIAKKYLIKI